MRFSRPTAAAAATVAAAVAAAATITTLASPRPLLASTDGGSSLPPRTASSSYQQHFNNHNGSSSSSSSSSSSRGPARQKFAYVILGTGTTAQAALETLRAGAADPSKEILMIGPHTVLPRMDGTELDKHSSLLDVRLSRIYDEWRRQLSNVVVSASSSGWEGGGGGTAATGGGVSVLRASGVDIDLERRVLTASTVPPQGMSSSSNGGMPSPSSSSSNNNNSSSSSDVEIEYEECVLATAGRPREFYVLDSDKLNWATSDQINILYTPLDFQNLSKTVSDASASASPKHITVVGGGYLGTETVCALAESKQCRITHVLGERAPLAQYLPRYLSDAIGRRLRQLGVDIRQETLVTGLVVSGVQQHGDGEEDGPPERLQLDLVGRSQTKLDTDYLVLASTNVTADLMGLDKHPAAHTGLEVAQGGIMVNSSLEAYRHFFVAGNAATYFDPHLGRRRVDTYDHAVASGMWAAHNMLNTDQLQRYTHQPTFRSALPGLGLSFVGIGRVDAQLDTVGVWYRHQASSDMDDDNTAATGTATEAAELEFKRGIVYYLDSGRVVGLLLCNCKEMTDRAREVLASTRVVTDAARELPNTILLAPSHWLTVVVSKPVKHSQPQQVVVVSAAV